MSKKVERYDMKTMTTFGLICAVATSSKKEEKAGHEIVEAGKKAGHEIAEEVRDAEKKTRKFFRKEQFDK